MGDSSTPFDSPPFGSPTFANFDFDAPVADAPADAPLRQSEIEQGFAEFDSIVNNFQTEAIGNDAPWDMFDEIPNDTLYALPSDVNNGPLNTSADFDTVDFGTESPATDVQRFDTQLDMQPSASGSQQVGQAYQPTYMSNMLPQGYFPHPLMQGMQAVQPQQMYLPTQFSDGWQYGPASAGPSGLAALPSYNNGSYNPFASLEYAPVATNGGNEQGMQLNQIEVVESAANPTNPRTSSSSSSKSIELSAVLQRSEYQAEKPKLDPKHPWVRINRSTQGTTKRCGKINKFDASKLYKELTNTFENWKSSGYEFSYNVHGELSDPVYATAAIKQFIYEHPVRDDAKLRLWIQKTPADSARRYPTLLSSKCRFHQCPVHQHLGTGTLVAGHVRVAFDERSFTHGDKADPFYMAGFVHLYCLEKFLDLPEICTLPHIEVAADLRQLQNEPNQKYAASLTGGPDGVVAKRFIDACLRTAAKKIPIRNFERYPRAANVAPNDKKHEDMLNYRMNQVKEENRSAAQKRALASRGLKDTHINVNMGDLERYCEARLKSRKHKYPVDNDDEETGPVGKKRKASEAAIEDEIPAPVRSKKRKAPKPKRKSRAARASPIHSESPFDGDSTPYQSSDDESSLFVPRVAPPRQLRDLSPSSAAGKKRSREADTDDDSSSFVSTPPSPKKRKVNTRSVRSLSSSPVSSPVSTVSSLSSDTSVQRLRRSPRHMSPTVTSIEHDPASRQASPNDIKHESASGSDNSLFDSGSDTDSRDSMLEP
ncbi:uncharacterized protein K452DRAFT_317515 [Aplosporella prunicola CBS 121167]|uniref:Uncharacterized protein n=1 Tax=Aplosporella prunicola CBS 121167 TaxID=1176127 RepID=A0A6A6BHA1_9PEZI|nr:uncharacterized protein K452DRAFT_317515 [Aplosporella prunicola CBS 121167]KAF2143356.1 hypothetical protein K452DRAFT_317515 [Aplosporella prunicola CBS 121167]